MADTKKEAKASQIKETVVPSSVRRGDKEDLLNSYGSTGTALVSGFISEEHNATLAGLAGIEKFDKMRKTDAQVFATLLAMELPIRSTRWFVEPSKNADDEIDDQAREVQAFVEKNLFELMDSTRDSLLQEILTMLPFGFSIFEKVYGFNDGKIIVKKLGFRKQSTIYKREQEDGSAGVVQYLPAPAVEGVNKGQTSVSIPAHKLLIFTFRKEGDNYEGTSVLRSAYRHRYIKDKLYIYDAIRHERQSMGIPVIYLPDSASETDKAEALKIVQNIRGSEQSGIVVPGSKNNGRLFEFADLKAGQSTDLFESIKHHNREIAKNILAQFLELGDTASGSRSLSEDQSDLFLLSLTAVANQIADIINRFLIPELVDLNFDVKEYPKLKFNKLGDTDYQTFANTLATLAGSELLNPDENIEDFIREMLGLPAREVDAESETPEMDDETDPMDDGGDGGDGGDGTDPLDDLQSELETLSASEDDDDFDCLFDEIIESVEFKIDEAAEFIAKGDAMPEETKKKISEALKKRSGGTLIKQKESLGRSIESKSEAISKTNQEFKKKTDAIRSEIDSIKAMKSKIGKKATAAKVKALLGKVKELRSQRDSATKPLRELKAEDIKSKKQIAQAIRERKKEIAAKVKSLRSDLEAGRKTLQEAIEPMKQDVKNNLSQIKSLRQSLEGVKGERRDAIKAMIQGLMDENAGNRETQSKFRSDFGGKREAVKSEIKKIKDSSGLYHDHDCGEACGGNIDLEYLAVSKMFNNKSIIELQNQTADAEAYAKLKNKGFKFNEYEKDSPRPMTFAERKVNFTSLSRAMETFNGVLEEKVTEITDKMKADLLEQVKKAVEANDIAAVGKIKAKRTGELSQALTDVQKELFEIGKKSASTEMNVPVPPTKAEVRGAMRVQNDAIIEAMVGNIETTTKTAVTQIAAKKGGSITATGATEAVAAASQNIDKALEKAKASLNTLGITGAVNLGRASIFERYPEKIYGFQYSAILDRRTTETCRSLDGLIVQPGSDDFYNYAPPRHFNCRSIWVEILQEETFKPKFTGVPAGIPTNATIETFKDLKAPIILKNSPAVKIVQQELDERKAKLEELEKSGQFPNRQEQHKERIKELEASLKKAEENAFSEYVRGILTSDGVSFKSDGQN